ncbi:MAG: NAD(P)/FAD-dependent oxidoreductase [Thermoanaerobaculia bacterium]
MSGPPEPVEREWDVVIVGGGPSGSIAAVVAARRGLSTLVLEKSRHPRFQIGESLLAKNLRLLEELGIADGVEALPRTIKTGGSFAFGNGDELVDFLFTRSLEPHAPDTFNIERSIFDEYLAGCARREGATVVEGVTVREVRELDHGRVTLGVRDEAGVETVVSGRCLLDASGQATVVGRHLGTRRPLPELRKIAYYGQMQGVERRAGEPGGYPVILFCDEGWFWLIPLDEERTSVGFVVDEKVARGLDVPAKEMLAWGIERCPFVARLTRRASSPEWVRVAADFSYRCEPYAGPGYFLLGDAATFVDPVFSTGVCLGMASGARAAELAAGVLDGSLAPERAARVYGRFVAESSAPLFQMVRHFYRHSFRELFLHGHGMLKVHRAVTTALAGFVFPRPSFRVRWRLRLFDLLVDLQERWPLVPRRDGWSLLREAPSPGLQTEASRASTSTGPA